MVAMIQRFAPELFTKRARDGSRFKCSDSFVRKYLRDTMGWSERRTTRAAQKLPPDHEKILYNAFLREAYVIRDHGIPAELRVNTDQTQLIYQLGTKKTWNQKGVSQVPALGMDEKRAFTLVPSISASGELLPMQAIYGGKTAVSCPNGKADRYAEAKKLGCQFLPSKTDTYWSTHETMHSLVNDVIAPYFEGKKKKLGLPSSQRSIWKIDCWSVHKSESFRNWMKKHHPTIIIIFVPGGCTGLWQPLDVGLQRIMKQSMKCSAHRDIVTEATAKLATISSANDLRLDVTVGNLRNRSVGWIVDAISEIDDPELIKKVK